MVTVLLPISGSAAGAASASPVNASCAASIIQSVTTQYEANPPAGVSLPQLLQDFDNSLCSANVGIPSGASSTVTTYPVGLNPPSTAVTTASTAYTNETDTLYFGASAFGGGTIISLEMQGTFKYNYSDAIGLSTFCQPTSSPFPTYSYQLDYCGWVNNGGTGYPNSYALMRYLFTITQTLFGISAQQNYWYWLNAYPNGTHQFGCNEC